jgi:DNA-binding XRE family transcriptional regulator
LKSIRSPEQRELAKLLRYCRLHARPKRLTQDQLARKLGFENRKSVIRIEQGDVAPEATLVRRWCAACRRSSRELWLAWERNCRRLQGWRGATADKD